MGLVKGMLTHETVQNRRQDERDCYAAHVVRQAHHERRSVTHGIGKRSAHVLPFGFAQGRLAQDERLCIQTPDLSRGFGSPRSW